MLPNNVKATTACLIRDYDASAEKGYFCYEWLNDASKLKEKQLPPIEAFHSSLKGYNVLESKARRELNALMDSGIPQVEALDQLRLTEPPLTKEEVYEMQQQLWRDQKMETMMDYSTASTFLNTLPHFVRVFSSPMVLWY